MTKLAPLVSIIVAAYNEEKYIGRCLRSLLNQTMPQDQYEIIVVNDGSTDRTNFALELFHDAIRPITNSQNIGLPASINKGILASKAPYVVRVDAVACDYWLFNNSEEWLERVDCSEKPIACGIMFRKQHLINIGMYDEAFRCHEDRDLRIRFEKTYSIRRLELPLYRYRRHDDNLTNNSEAMEHHRLGLVRKHGTD